jgi:predicted nucleic acid-binding protein
MSFMIVERYTLDTNVLVYAVDPSEGEKHDVAARVVDQSIELPCILTVQALAEFVSVAARRRMKSRADAVAQARDWLRVFPTVAADARALEAAYTAVEEGRFALFDALLLATARDAGCTMALSEDMHDGAALDGIVVRNPFADGGLAADLRPLLGLA